jgi:hypothetical protein
MSFIVERIEFESAPKCLREVLYAARTGVFRSDPAINVDAIVAAGIRRLKAELAQQPTIFNEVERLRLLTLEAEHYQENGEFHNAARVLKPVWDGLAGRIKAWGKSLPLEPSRDKSLCRQKIWALLDYLFFAYCRVEGRESEAAQQFCILERIIRGELETADRVPHGTLALCQYFIGICHNGIGSSEAERYLLEAQKHTQQRAARELARDKVSQVERDYASFYRDIFSARILSGLARVNLQRGHLVQAEHLLYAAQNLLVAKQRESLKRLISTLLLTVQRRSGVAPTFETNS